MVELLDSGCDWFLIKLLELGCLRLHLDLISDQLASCVLSGLFVGDLKFDVCRCLRRVFAMALTDVVLA